MCGRYAYTLPNEAMTQLFGAVAANDLPEMPNFNVCPTNQIHVVYSAGDIRRLGAMRWGFVPSWYKSFNDGPLLINARSETIAEKPAFREACRLRRCIIPMSGFYEWDRSGEAKLPWYITPSQGDTFAFAGIWQDWVSNGERHQTCAMVTTKANTAMGKIHHRMPVFLAQKDWGLWLGEEGHGAAPLMRPAGENAMQFHRVSTDVNSNRASGPKLIEPI